VRAQASLYWHSISQLRPIQVYRRIWFRLHRPKPDLAPPPPLRRPRGQWVPPAQRRQSLVGPVEFRFLGVTGSLTDVGWDGAQREKLWRYNQHYFDDLNAIDAGQRRAWQERLLSRWTQENPAGVGNGWEPYPTSLRIVNWVKWSLAGNPLPAECVSSLAVQARWLSRRIEWHLLGNHLFANGKALIFTGLAFDGDESRRWLEAGLRIVEQQLDEQVLPDGGHFERSTMYHAIVLEDLLDLINSAAAWAGSIDAATVARWRSIAARMLDWLREMVHPDGEIALFNDAAFGIAPTPEEIAGYAARLAIAGRRTDRATPSTVRAVHLPDSGYVRVDVAPAVLLIDVAPIGPDYLPGHGHADTLSFEMSVGAQRVFVNGGTSRYGVSEERLQERHTRSHATVEIDGASSSEIWGGFRVARRAHPFDLALSSSPGRAVIGCSHDGYRRLPGHPVHRREWCIEPGRLEVTDVVTGDHGRAVARYIIHPDVAVTEVAANRYQLDLSGDGAVQFRSTIGRCQLEPGRYAPEFGVVRAARCLAVDLQDGMARVVCTWD
jgi:uncharacterized heparinase superfamily protein